jgi:alpha-galactosidase
MIEKLVLIGAGSASFTRGLVADIIQKNWQGEIALVDIDRSALEVASGLAKKMLDARGSGVKLSAFTNRCDALPDATAVICTISVGGRDAWQADVLVPRKYGIFQPVGDTVMPGGSSRALRMIPAMVDIARDVMDLAPDALFFNYGNPMSAVCRAVHKDTGAKMVGLCHGVHDVAGGIADHLGTTRDQLVYTAIGINHLTWFTRILMDGRDAMPRLREIAGEKLRTGFNSESPGRYFVEAGGSEAAVALNLVWPFTFELVRLFGAFPAVGDRHITEFFPHMFSEEGAYFGKTLGVDVYSFERCIEDGHAKFAEMKADALSAQPLGDDYFERISGEHEQVTDIIESIRSNAGTVFSANLPNRGQIPNLPPDAVVECPAIADATGLHAIDQEPIDPAIAGTLATGFQWVETIVDAALCGSRERFVQALLLDGAVKSVETAYRLADDLLETQREFLPRFYPGE